MAPTDLSKHDRQYQAWGVVVQTSNVRAGHIANGIVQLLRLAHDPPAWQDLSPAGFVESYLRRAQAALKERFGAAWRLSPQARALCVYTSKKGPLLLEDERDDEPEFVGAGRQHVDQYFRLSTPRLPAAMHKLLADALNADGRVRESGADDPTTPALAFGGFDSNHTLRGMHAATFLGLLSRTEAGAVALAKLYRLLRRGEDPHSRLIDALRLSIRVDAPEEIAAKDLLQRFPLPAGPGWEQLAEVAGAMAQRLLAWCEAGASKADTLMAMVDLASLLLFLRLMRWQRDPSSGQDPRLLLLVSPQRPRGDLRNVIARAQQSLQAAAAALDAGAGGTAENRAPSLIHTGKKGTTYLPSAHALNLGAAGGWLFPLDSRGGAKRYVRPGPRQLATLVHALVSPHHEMPWPAFTSRAETELGLALGGPNERRTEGLLRIGGLADSLRRAGQANREHLVALGLARRESDNVVIIDGGTP